MKCIHCSTENNYKDRQSTGQSRCKKCFHPFAFEPKSDPHAMSDTLFERVIKDVSADGTLCFTPKQLWYELNRRLLARKTLSCGAHALPILIGGGALYGLRHGGIALFVLAALMMAAAATPKKKPKQPAGPRYPKLHFDVFNQSYLYRWVELTARSGRCFRRR